MNALFLNPYSKSWLAEVISLDTVRILCEAYYVYSTAKSCFWGLPDGDPAALVQGLANFSWELVTKSHMRVQEQLCGISQACTAVSGTSGSAAKREVIGGTLLVGALALPELLSTQWSVCKPEVTRKHRKATLAQQTRPWPYRNNIQILIWSKLPAFK